MTISLLPKQSTYSGATAWQMQQVSGGGSRRRDEGVVTPFGKFPNLSGSSCLSFFFFFFFSAQKLYHIDVFLLATPPPFEKILDPPLNVHVDDANESTVSENFKGQTGLSFMRPLLILVFSLF